MSYKCDICGKKPVAGFSYSHSNRASKRLFKPNLQKQKVQLNGLVQSVKLCTTCIKSGKSVRPLKHSKKG
ncbi:MAG TPA: 50S ribosomal protein L28 [Elusimicrobia bacterium]|nr:50S ribosomal protein L28 [Elusimicrobiota bacterium]